MTIKNVSYISAKKLSKEQRIELGLPESLPDEGLVAIETHNPEYKLKGVLVEQNIVDYILED